jgi:methylmalonyl-CoA mutase N-terminal domain/subunit
LGGSYLVEALTDEIEAAAYDYFRRIDELGGMVEAVKQNFCQREIADASFELQSRIDAGERIVVGVNRYTEGDDEEHPILRIDPALERKQIGRVDAVRAARESEPVELALADLRAAADSHRNLMPLLIDAARVHASEGEIVDSLQAVWGAYVETPVF